MTKFNPEKKDVLTYGECLDPAMKITDQEDADQYLADYIAYTKKAIKKVPNKDGKSAEEICKINLGYWAGYYGNETMERVERLFKCSHPVFGSIKSNGGPTTQEAFECGKQRKTLAEIRK